MSNAQVSLETTQLIDDDSGHHVHFYGEGRFISDTVAEFLAAGIRSGQPVVLISTPEHRDEIFEQLVLHGSEVHESAANGLCTWVSCLGKVHLEADDGLERTAGHAGTTRRSAEEGEHVLTKIKGDALTRTSEDVPVSALYAAQCCDIEVTFDKGSTFTRCPECERLVEWQLVRLAPAPLRAA